MPPICHEARVRHKVSALSLHLVHHLTADTSSPSWEVSQILSDFEVSSCDSDPMSKATWLAPSLHSLLSNIFTEGSMAELVVLNGGSVTTQFDIVEKIQAL